MKQRNWTDLDSILCMYVALYSLNEAYQSLQQLHKFVPAQQSKNLSSVLWFSIILNFVGVEKGSSHDPHWTSTQNRTDATHTISFMLLHTVINDSISRAYDDAIFVPHSNWSASCAMVFCFLAVIPHGPSTLLIWYCFQYGFPIHLFPHLACTTLPSSVLRWHWFGQSLNGAATRSTGNKVNSIV